MPALIFCGEFLLHIPCWLLFLIWGVSHIHPVLLSFLSEEFLLNILWWLHLYLGSFSFTSHADFFYVGVLLHIRAALIFMQGISLTHPLLAPFFYLGSFSYTSRAGFILSGEFLLHIPCWLHFYLGSFSDTSRAGFSFTSHVGSFSYTSYAGFTFLLGVSLTHPILSFFCFVNLVLASFLST